MYLDDAPISYTKDDQLNRVPFVSRLADTILKVKSGRSIVVGLYGPWGSGKSSVLHMLSEVVRKDNSNKSKVNVIQFDPWFYNSEKELLDSFLDLISNEIKTFIGNRKTKNELSSLLNNYYKNLKFSIEPKIKIGFVTIGADVKDKKYQDNNLNNLRSKIQNELRKFDFKIVVLIDNLDRLEHQELLLILKLVRLCSDFPNILYVLAFDQKQVINTLQKSANIDPNYLSKIIQVDLHLPKIEQVKIDEYLGKAIDSIAETNKITFENDISERFGFLYQEIIRMRLITDFRTAKRFLNAIAFSMPMVKNEVNFADFLALEVIRVFFPSIYHELPKFKKELTSFDTISIGDWRIREKKSSFKALVKVIDEYIESVTEDEQNRTDFDIALKGILKMMFPILRTILLIRIIPLESLVKIMRVV